LVTKLEKSDTKQSLKLNHSRNKTSLNGSKANESAKHGNNCAGTKALKAIKKVTKNDKCSGMFGKISWVFLLLYRNLTITVRNEITIFKEQNWPLHNIFGANGMVRIKHNDASTTWNRGKSLL